MRRWLAVTLACLMAAGIGAGCRTSQEQPEATPEIPAEISQGKNKEPRLKVYLADQDKVTTLDLEEYISGVVAAEMDPEWPLEALAAQAIEARTFTLQKIAEQGTLPNRDAHASTNIEEFQAYNPTRINDNVKEAVRKTRGLVAVYQGEYVRGWFHAYCGGVTATPKVGLNYQGEAPEYLKPVENPCRQYVNEEIEFWTKSFSKSAIREAVKTITNEDPGDFLSIEIIDAENGRATSFKVGSTTVSAAELRLALGSTEMRSTLVDKPTISGDKVTFIGRGYGHGVGLCQWGAKGWAEEGKNAEEIVKAFFPGVSIIRQWD